MSDSSAQTTAASQPDETASKLLWWILGLGSSIVMAGGAAWMSSIDSKATELQKAIVVVKEQTTAATAEQATKIALVRQDVDSMKQTLEKIDGKIDRILDGRTNRPTGRDDK